MGKNKYITARIISVLTNDIPCRDSYMRTIQILHDEELNFMRKDQSDYYKMFFDKKLSSVNTIIRMWRKIQEVHIGRKDKFSLLNLEIKLMCTEKTNYTFLITLKY
jgi:hypothetical protein